jgi:uncharacterized protein (DUF697 family)
VPIDEASTGATPEATEETTTRSTTSTGPTTAAKPAATVAARSPSGPSPAGADEPGTGETEAGAQPVPLGRAMEARKLCRSYMVASAAAGAVPAPVVDMAALAAVQLKMLHSLASLYEVPFSKELGHAAVATLITSLGAPSVARGTFGSLIKVIPVVGSVAGALAMPAVAAAASYAIGRTFILHFETGGTLLDFDPKKMRRHFLELYQEGGKVADDVIGGAQ